MPNNFILNLNGIKKIWKIIAFIFGFSVSIFMILVLFVSLRWDKKYDSPYPDLVSSSDSSIIARGQYLVYGLAQCADCHAGIDVYEPGEEIPNM